LLHNLSYLFLRLEPITINRLIKYEINLTRGGCANVRLLVRFITRYSSIVSIYQDVRDCSCARQLSHETRRQRRSDVANHRGATRRMNKSRAGFLPCFFEYSGYQIRIKPCRLRIYKDGSVLICCLQTRGPNAAESNTVDTNVSRARVMLNAKE
jgi:hypothetical protein